MVIIMAKEKKQIPKTTKKDFFYEITGTLTILLCLILLSELGSVGIFLKNLFKIIFGDFYFIIVFYLIISGILALVKEKWFNFKSLRFNGFIMFICSLLLLVHISFLDIYNIKESSILKDTIDIYKDTLFGIDKNIESFGGGIIGAIFSQIFVVLFNRIGALIFSIIFICLSFSLMTNINLSSIIRFFKFIFNKVKKFFVMIYHYFKNIDFPTRRESVGNYSVLLNLNLLSDIESNQNDLLQLKISNDEKEMLISLIYQLNGFVTNNKLMVGYSQTRYVFTGNFNNIEENKFDTFLNRKIIFYKEQSRLIIEVSNKLKKLLSLKSLLLLSVDSQIPVGIEISDQILYFSPITNQNMLISGSLDSGVKNFLKGFVTSLLFQLKDKFQLTIIDPVEELSDLKFMPNLFFPYNKKIERVDDLLDELSNELEKRLNIVNENECENYLTLNKILENKKIPSLKPIYCIINNLDYFKGKNTNLNQKIIYFLKFGFKAGIHLIMVSRSSGVNSNIIANTKTKLVFKSDTIDQSFEILNSKNGCALNKNGDALMVVDLNIYHIQTPYISDSDFIKIINKFI